MNNSRGALAGARSTLRVASPSLPWAWGSRTGVGWAWEKPSG